MWPWQGAEGGMKSVMPIWASSFEKWSLELRVFTVTTMRGAHVSCVSVSWCPACLLWGHFSCFSYFSLFVSLFSPFRGFSATSYLFPHVSFPISLPSLTLILHPPVSSAYYPRIPPLFQQFYPRIPRYSSCLFLSCSNPACVWLMIWFFC